MTLEEFYNKVLGLDPEGPWEIEGVKMAEAGMELTIVLRIKEGWKWIDGDGAPMHVHGWVERRWRHLPADVCRTYLEGKVPRLKKADGSTEMAPTPWAGAKSRWTLSFEAVALKTIAASASIADAADILGIGWESAHDIMRRGVNRGLERRDADALQALGIDEKHYGKGRFATVLSDPAGARVLDVHDGRDKQAAKELLGDLPQTQRKAIKSVVMDLTETYPPAVREILGEDVRIVVDRFHVAQLLGRKLDIVRRAENKAMSSAGSDQLKGTRILWLYNPENMDEDSARRFERINKANLKTSRAWRHVHNFRAFYKQIGYFEAIDYFQRWYASSIRSRLAPIKQAARTLKARLEDIANYYLSGRLTNAGAEALNASIQAIQSAAKGITNFAHYRVRTRFFLGKLDMLPNAPVPA